MRNAGYSLSLLNDALAVEPATLDERQQQFVMKVRDRFIQLLHDAKFVEGLVEEAGTSGLDWKQGTETWDDIRLLAANAVLYATNRIVNYDGVRYHQSVARPKGRSSGSETRGEVSAVGAASQLLSSKTRNYGREKT